MAITLSETHFNEMEVYRTNNEPPAGSTAGICIYRRNVNGGSEYYAIFSYLNDQGMTYVNTLNPFDLPSLITSSPTDSIKQLTTNGDFPMQHPNLIVVFFPMDVIGSLISGAGSVAFDDTQSTLVINGKSIQAPSLMASANNSSNTGRPMPPPW